MPQPIDMQTELARVSTMERVQQIADRQSLAAHQRVADQAVQQQVNAETQTHQAEQKSEELERDLRRHTPHDRPPRHSEKRGHDEKPKSAQVPPVPPAEPHRLDISV